LNHILSHCAWVTKKFNGQAAVDSRKIIEKIISFLFRVLYLPRIEKKNKTTLLGRMNGIAALIL
jgi:hypothetical protein